MSQHLIAVLVVSLAGMILAVRMDSVLSRWGFVLRARVPDFVAGPLLFAIGAGMLFDHFSWARHYADPTLHGWAWWSEALRWTYDLAAWPWPMLATVLIVGG